MDHNKNKANADSIGDAMQDKRLMWIVFGILFVMLVGLFIYAGSGESGGVSFLSR